MTDFSYYKSFKVIDPIAAIQKYSNQKDMVFVSGVFDVLHYGHIYFLRKAKAVVEDRGTLLVVVHEDEIVNEKKGRSRPINPLNYRIELLTELESVDLVMPWEGWEDLKQFVWELRPGNIAVTEKQFENKSIKKVTEDLGISLHVIKNPPELSSSKIIELLKSNNW